MKKEYRYFGFIIIIISCFLLQGHLLFTGNLTGNIDQISQTIINKSEGGKLVPDVNFGNIPLYFIHNKGQVNKKALFYVKTPGYTLWVTVKSSGSTRLILKSLREHWWCSKATAVPERAPCCHCWPVWIGRPGEI